MHKPGYSRNVIQIISRYSNLSERDIKTLFQENRIHADRAAWIKFADTALPSMGAAFLLAGVVFFFAYNWQDLHKFSKLVTIQLLVSAPVVSILLFKPGALIRNILLTLSCVFVGVLFAVFGQIYQTGADAYDLFLGWTIFIAIWAFSVRFEVLWLIFLILINLTFILYVNQAGPYWLGSWLFLILYTFNALIVLFLYLQGATGKIANWFSRTIAFGAVSMLTLGLIAGMFNDYPAPWYISLFLGMVSYAAGTWYSIKQKLMYLLCILPISVIVVLCALLLQVIGAEAGAFFMMSVCIVACTTFLVRELLRLNKIWHGTKS